MADRSFRKQRRGEVVGLMRGVLSFFLSSFQWALDVNFLVWSGPLWSTTVTAFSFGLSLVVIIFSFMAER